MHHGAKAPSQLGVLFLLFCVGFVHQLCITLLARLSCFSPSSQLTSCTCEIHNTPPSFPNEDSSALSHHHAPPQPKEIGLPFTAYYAIDEVREVSALSG